MLFLYFQNQYKLLGMVIGFKEKNKGVSTHFKEKILAGVMPELAQRYCPKLHTMRAGNRWKAGDIIHMATGVRTRSYCQFNEGIDALSKVISVQDVKIEWKKPKTDVYDFNIFVDGEKLNHFSIIQFTQNDGFTLIKDFAAWFNEDFEGQLIHWTDLRY